MVRLIVFDLDGTLVDSSMDITNAINYATKELGLPRFSVSRIIELVGEGISRLVEKALPMDLAGHSEEVLAKFLDHYSGHLTDHTRPYPGVEETLPILSTYRKIVLSNKREDLSRRVLEETGLLRHFDMVIGSDTFREKKPSPMPILAVLEKFALHKNNAVIVGDSDVDILTGKRAGIYTIAVSYGYRSRDALREADHIIDRMDELVPLLREISRLRENLRNG